MSVAGAPWTVRGDHVLLSVRLTPRAAQDRIDGVSVLSDGMPVLAVRVRAIPEDNGANKALCRLLSKALGIPGRSVSLASGHTARLKSLRIEGAPEGVVRGLEQVAGGRSGV